MRAAIGILACGLVLGSLVLLFLIRPQESTASKAEPAAALDARASESRLEHSAVEPEARVEAEAATTTGGRDLRLSFVSALDGSPVPDLPFLVYRERGGDKELARGRSDAQGRAEVRDLEPNVILVETARRPPFARTVAGCWLERGASIDLVVRLEAGGRVVGRVVDDLGSPVEGAEILLGAELRAAPPPAPTPLDAALATARTGADGRFAIDHVSNHPRSVWIVDGAMRPEHSVPERIHVRKDGALAEVEADVKPGETLDLGDIPLIRLATATGFVLDPDAVPVAGALVSRREARRVVRRYGGQRPDRSANPFFPAPGEDGFRLLAGETLTDADGRFTLLVEPRPTAVAVWTPRKQRQVFDVPALAPGERSADLYLRLDAITMLEVELADETGARVSGPGATARERGLYLYWRRNPLASLDRAEASVELGDGSREEGGAAADGDGLYRFEWKAAPARIRRFAMRVPGYEPIVDAVEDRLESTTRLAYLVRESPAVRLRLEADRSAKQEATGAGEPVRLFVQICLATPDQRAAQPSAVYSCCGLGAQIPFDWSGEERGFVLPAVAQRPHWVYVRGSRPKEGLFDVAAFGPFEPGGDVHAIELDFARLRELSRATPADGARAQLSGLGYAEGAPDEPKAQLRGRLLEADGRPAPAETWVRAIGTESLSTGFAPMGRTDAEGRFTLTEVSGASWLEAFVPSGAQRRAGSTGQRLPATGWSVGEEKTFRLLPWQQVDVRVGGAALDPPGNSLILRACPAPGEPGSFCDHRGAEPKVHGPLLGGMEVEPEPGFRVYRFRTAPGRYQVYGRGLLREVPAQEIAVRESDRVQVFELTSR